MVVLCTCHPPTESPTSISFAHSAFSTGRANAIVCDCGAGSTSAVPVLDGYTLNRVGGRSPRGGDWLDEQVGAWLAGKKLSVGTLGGGGGGKGAEAPPASYRAFQEQRAVRDVKESCCMVPQPLTEDGAALDVPEGGGEPCYELPDGTKIMPEPALVRIPGGYGDWVWDGCLGIH
jgi:hypothetical protein